LPSITEYAFSLAVITSVYIIEIKSYFIQLNSDPMNIKWTFCLLRFSGLHKLTSLSGLAFVNLPKVEKVSAI